MIRARILGATVAAMLVVTLQACGGDETPGAGGGPKETTVSVTLQEWGVVPAQGSASAGKITFTVENKGPEHEHEFIVAKTSLDPGALPVKADGSVDEAGTGLTAIGEIEEFAVGTTQSKSFDLAAGSYVLYCNVVETEAMPDTGGITSHYKLGMRIAFTVT